MTIETELKDLKDHVIRLDERLNHMSKDLAVIKGSQETTTQLLKYVVTPLIIILGALVGLRLIF